MKCEKCGAELNEKNICPLCGWMPESEIDSDDLSQEKVDIESLENLEVNFDEVNGSDDEQEIDDSESFKASNDDLVIDFDEINNKAEEPKSKKGGSSWLVAFVSFIAGVLATLITIGCFNGTIISYFDRITNGSPKEAVENFCEFYYEADGDEKTITKTFSPYLRAQIVSELKSYTEYSGVETDINLDADVTKDSEFEKIGKYYLDLIKSLTTQKVNITNIKFNNIEYFKSGTDEFNSYLSEYKSSADEKVAKAEGVSVFAKVSFKINFSVENVEQTTAATEKQTESDKKADENKKDATETTSVTESTTGEQATSSVKEESNDCVVVCVKVNDTWQVFNGIQASKSAQ